MFLLLFIVYSSHLSINSSFYSKNNNDRETVCSDRSMRRKYTFMKMDEFAMGGEKKKKYFSTFDQLSNRD